MNIRRSKVLQNPRVKKFLLSVYTPVAYFFKYLKAKSMNDEEYIRYLYKKTFGEDLNLEHPSRLQEKMQWIKLYDRKPIYHKMVDKVDAKSYIAERVGEQYAIPTLAVYDSFDDINFDELPDKFVLKGTFDSGSFYICKDKESINKKELKKQLLINWKHDYYIWSREWPYKGLKHRIIAEPLLEDDSCPYLRDFKFYCFNGEPKIFYITSDKGTGLPTREDFFDLEGNHLEIQDVHYLNNPTKCPELPEHLDEMIRLCRVLAKDTYHLRVDFYEVNGRVYCGEFTFFESGGKCLFTPDSYNILLGNWIKLPIDK